MAVDGVLLLGDNVYPDGNPARVEATVFNDVVIAAENVFPPILSEVILPFAGFAVTGDSAGQVTVVLAATVGSALGAVVLYELGRWFRGSMVWNVLRVGAGFVLGAGDSRPQRLQTC